MATPTAEELMALPPEYLAEQGDSNELWGTSLAFIIVPTAIFALFLTSRWHYAGRSGWETWVLYPVAYLLTMGLCVLGLLLVRIGGAGRHIEYFMLTDPTIITNYLKLQTATEFIYMAGVTVPKVTLLLLYLRIFTERKIRIITWVVIGICITHFLTSGVIVGFTVCQPFAFKWDKTIPGGKCADLMAAYRYVSVPNIITDLAIVFLPLRTLYHLQMSKTQKWGILLTFLTGSLGIITAILRFVGFYTLDLESDPTFLCIDTMKYTIIESGAYFICSCLPGLRPLLRVVYQKAGIATGLSQPSDGGSTSTQKYRFGLTLTNAKGTNRSTVSGSRPLDHSRDDDTAGFIRLEETVRVDRRDANDPRRTEVV